MLLAFANRINMGRSDAYLSATHLNQIWAGAKVGHRQTPYNEKAPSGNGGGFFAVYLLVHYAFRFFNGQATLRSDQRYYSSFVAGSDAHNVRQIVGRVE